MTLRAFFRSRWVDAPAGVEELDPGQPRARLRRRAAFPAASRTAAAPTSALSPADDGEVASALLLTRNAAAAAPIRVCRDSCRAEEVRAVIVNSGNANAATGEQGIADALRMRGEAAECLGLEPETVAVAETGVIGVPLDIDSVSAGIEELCGGLSEDGAGSFSDAICTTDRWPKRCTVRMDGVTISAQAKGAGMIEPGFATMLCFVQTDAVLDNPDGHLRCAVGRLV